MSSSFQKMAGKVADEANQAVNDINASEVANSVTYRQNANFSQSRNSRLNKNQMQSARCIKAALVLLNIFINVWMIANNHGLYGSYTYVLINVICYYSLWGSTLAFVSHIFSILACNFDGWFKLAYITTEISFSVNTMIFFAFWLLIWPAFMYTNALKTAHEKWYQGLLHAVPWLTTVSELAMTDLALEKRHWWIMFLVMCPTYALCNMFGAKTLPHLIKAFPHGSVYGAEAWNTNPIETFVGFAIAGLLQAGIYYCCCCIVERCWPKRAEEEYELKAASLLNSVADQIKS